MASTGLLEPQLSLVAGYIIYASTMVKQGV